MIRETYFNALPSPVFMIGSGVAEAESEPDIIHLACDDTYEGLPQKLWTFYKWLLESSNFEFVFRVDDDCVVHLQALYAFLFSLYSSHERPDYLGSSIIAPTATWSPGRTWHIGKVSDPRLNVPYGGSFTYQYCNGGTGVFLSRRAVALIVASGRSSFFDPNEFYEDKLHGDVLGSHGITPCDVGAPIVTTDLPLDQMRAQHLVCNGTVGCVGPTFAHEA